MAGPEWVRISVSNLLWIGNVHRARTDGIDRSKDQSSIGVEPVSRRFQLDGAVAGTVKIGGDYRALQERGAGHPALEAISKRIGKGRILGA
jgi:hypothetical protein